MILETERLVLRQWRESDRAPYVAFNSDAKTRRFYPGILTAAQSNATIDRFKRGIEEDGHGFWAVERKNDGAFIGDVGFVPVEIPLRGNPPFEMGWLIGRRFWGNGYAPEAAKAGLEFAFTTLKLPEMVAFTARPNLPSQRVMEKIGMKRDLDGDFEHPKVPAGHRLRPHLLFRITNPYLRRT